MKKLYDLSGSKKNISVGISEELRMCLLGMSRVFVPYDKRI